MRFRSCRRAEPMHGLTSEKESDSAPYFAPSTRLFPKEWHGNILPKRGKMAILLHLPVKQVGPEWPILTNSRKENNQAGGHFVRDLPMNA